MFGLPAIAAWFATSKTGRALAAAGAVALAIGVALLRAFSRGKAAERAKQNEQSLENRRQRQAIDDDVENLGRADLDRRLRRWVPDDRRK